MNGFSAARLTQLLVDLGILSSQNRPTIDSKARNWMAVIEALQKNKYLVYGESTSLRNSLVIEYGDIEGLPRLRTIQLGFTSKSAEAVSYYERALALSRRQ
jgi:hypothetical protein